MYDAFALKPLSEGATTEDVPPRLDMVPLLVTCFRLRAGPGAGAPADPLPALSELEVSNEAIVPSFDAGGSLLGRCKCVAGGLQNALSVSPESAGSSTVGARQHARKGMADSTAEPLRFGICNVWEGNVQRNVLD